MDYAEEFLFLKKENNRIQKRLDKIEQLFAEAYRLIYTIKYEVDEVRKWERLADRADELREETGNGTGL